MSKKIPLGIFLAGIFIAVAIAVSVTVTVCMNVYNDLIRDLPQRAQLYSGLSDIDELVRANYYGDIDADALDIAIAKGYLSGLEDNSNMYLTAEEYSEYCSRMLGNVSGTGIEARFDEAEGVVKVIAVAQNSPGAQAEICAGDILEAIEGEDVTAENADTLLALLEGEKLTGVTLEVRHPADENSKEKIFSVKVAKGYKAQSCYYGIAGTVGYVKFTSFYENTVDTFNEAMTLFNESGVTGLVIDVRNNTSDNLEYAVNVIDAIVPMATEGSLALATAKNAAGEVVETFTSDSSSVNLPIAVLINDRTRGAAELLACDLRDFGKAKLFGETTAGHGTMQKVFRLDDGGAVILTVAVVYPYNSDCYNGVGVVPDETVIMSETEKDNLSSKISETDTQYAAALSYLS